MTLEEIEQASTTKQQVNQLKINAMTAKDKATQLKAQANVSAERLKMQQSKQTLAQTRKTIAGSTIKPHV